MIEKKRSPLKEVPLRLPGQSVQDEIDRLLSDKVDAYGVAFAASAMLIFWEWIRGFLPESHPALVACFVAPFMAYCAVRIWLLRDKVKALRLGRDGERLVAQQLSQLRAKGAIVFHDLPGTGFNVDHVVVSRRGIFAIETKTYSKRRSEQVIFDGKQLTVGGRKPDRDPVAQVRAIADWVSSTLKQNTGLTYAVRPVLVFPGWWINPVREQGGSDVWVLTPEAVPTFVTNASERLSEEQFRAAIVHLAHIGRIASS